MNEPILFSVIMPTYNRAALIGKAIRSILDQEYQNFELIIVNDGGIDNTEEIVYSFNDSRIRYYWKENEQKAIAKNFGFSKAEGTYVSSFDDDDLMKSNHLSEAFKLIKANLNPELVYVHYEIINPYNDTVIYPTSIEGDLKQLLIERNPLSNNGVFIRKDIIRDIYYSTNRKIKLSADWLLWIRLASRYPIYYTNNSTHQVLEHDNRGSSSATPSDFLGVREGFFEELKTDEIILECYGPKLSKTRGHFNTYIALFLSIQGYKLIPIQLLIQGVFWSPREIFTKRFLAIAKYLILSW